MPRDCTAHKLVWSGDEQSSWVAGSHTNPMSNRRFAGAQTDSDIFKSAVYKPDWNPRRAYSAPRLENDSKFIIGPDSQSSSLANSPLTSYGNSARTSRNNSVDTTGAAAAGLSTLGAASLAFPALAPVAAAAGIGYGLYKLGDSLNLW